jgi:hypothetical protein
MDPPEKQEQPSRIRNGVPMRIPLYPATMGRLSGKRTASNSFDKQIGDISKRIRKQATSDWLDATALVPDALSQVVAANALMPGLRGGGDLKRLLKEYCCGDVRGPGSSDGQHDDEVEPNRLVQLPTTTHSTTPPGSPPATATATTGGQTSVHGNAPGQKPDKGKGIATVTVVEVDDDESASRPSGETIETNSSDYSFGRSSKFSEQHRHSAEHDDRESPVDIGMWDSSNTLIRSQTSKPF